MALLIYNEGNELYPTKKQQYARDDFGIDYLSVVGSLIIPHWRVKNSNGKNLEKKEGMTAWHMQWQEEFQNKGFQLEVGRRDHNNTIRRADCLKENIKRVIEIQHSKMSYDDMVERTDAWLKMGYSIIWVFDGDTWLSKNYKFTNKEPYGNTHKLRFSRVNAAFSLADKFYDNKRVSVWLETTETFIWDRDYRNEWQMIRSSHPDKLKALYRVKDYFQTGAKNFTYCVNFSDEFSKSYFIKRISEKNNS